MATINYSISCPEVDSWTGYFEVTSTSGALVDDITSNNISAVGAGTELFSFTPVQFETYPDNPGTNVGRTYVTWRSVAHPGSQFPSTGYSFDIWSESLYTAINSGATWADLVSTGTYDLSDNKWTVVYSYDEPYALFHGKGVGATITFS